MNKSTFFLHFKLSSSILKLPIIYFLLVILKFLCSFLSPFFQDFSFFALLTILFVLT